MSIGTAMNGVVQRDGVSIKKMKPKVSIDEYEMGRTVG